MNRGRLLFILLSLTLVVPLATGTLLNAADKEEGEDSLYKYLAVFSEVLNLVRQTYVDETDVNTLMAGALDGTTDALDPFSLYVPANQVEGYLQAREIGRHHSGIHLLKERGVAFVVAMDKGSPAAEAGVKVADIVADLQGRDTRTMPLWEIQEILAAKPGTKIEMKLVRAGENHTASFALKPFTAPPAAIEKVEGASVLEIPTFNAETAAAVRAALAGAEAPADGRLLIDLRGVASGEGEAAYATARLFADGELGVLSGRKGPIASFTGTEPPAWKGKVVILVDRGTLGAAEVFATVLRQKIGAELVGERTFGYAGRQSVADLTSGGRLLVTDAFYTGPDKLAIRESLKPDLLVDERMRTFLQKDAPLRDLIFQQGLRRLRGESEPLKKAA